MASSLDFMLAKVYTEGMKAPRNTKNYNPPIGWLMSEKLDGYRSRFNPKDRTFVSRQNKLFNAPEWFVDFMPNHNFDGELFAGRDNFSDMGVVRKKVPIDEEWFKIKYYVYDCIDTDLEFYDRYEMLVEIVKEANDSWDKYKSTLGSKFEDVSCPIVLCEHIEVESMDQMKEYYKSVLDNGGEGIMFKDPWSNYENKRSNYLLKYKPNFDGEAIIVGHKDGTGKYDGMLGAFVCKPLMNKGDHSTIDEDPNHEFAISGMDDSIRESYETTHPIDTIITYEYSGFTNTGKPRFASYLRIRDDIVLKKENIKMENDTNTKLCVHIFERMSIYEKCNDSPFKAKAYDTACKALKNMNDTDLVSDELIKIKGIGKSLLEKIMTIVKTGTLEQYENIKDFKDPKEILMGVHGVGSVKAKELISRGMKNIDDLKNCEKIDEYLNDVQMKGLKWYDDIQHRIPYEWISMHEKYLKDILFSIDESSELTIAGSYRRKCNNSGDIDVLINTPSIRNNSIYNAFMDELFKREYMVEELSRGPKKFMGICKLNKDDIGIRIDIMYTKPQEYPFAIMYFTGSMEFNVKMRSELLKKGLSLNEYGIKRDKKNVKHDCKTEKEAFKYLGYDYVEPENR